MRPFFHIFILEIGNSSYRYLLKNSAYLYLSLGFTWFTFTLIINLCDVTKGQFPELSI